MKATNKILIAEDDANFGMMLKIFLEINGFEATLCENGQQAIQKLNENPFYYHLCILDVMMPELDGFDLAQKIFSTYKIPFVFLTAKSLKEDQLKGYQLGASDYLIKPFDPEILLIKINIIFQNTQKTDILKDDYSIGDYNFNTKKRIITLENNELKLSPKESLLLEMLCQKNGDILTYQEALSKIWGNDDYFTKQSMNVFITKLRKILSKSSQFIIEIENIHNKGLMMVIKSKK